MRSWGAHQTQELWRRMAFNALVGNIDDHPRNHGLLHDGTTWRLSPAFDITPVFTPREGSQLGLAMATGMDGTGDAGVERLLAAAPHFEVDVDEAAQWINSAAQCVANHWEAMLRDALAPLAQAGITGKSIFSSVRGSFEYAAALAQDPDLIERALDQAKKQKTRRRSGRFH